MITKFIQEASSLTGVSLHVEGKYRWIVFPSSKNNPAVPVVNRYYGVYEDGRIKIRGIEARRSDTPAFIKKAQLEIIRQLSSVHNYEDFLAQIPKALQILRKTAEKLIAGEVETNELLITKTLSKHPKLYLHEVHQAAAAKQLTAAGFNIHTGQTIQYLIINADDANPINRVKAAQLLPPKPRFDLKKYLKMLIEAGETLFGIFGYNSERLQSEVLHSQTQQTLNKT